MAVSFGGSRGSVVCLFRSAVGVGLGVSGRGFLLRSAARRHDLAIRWTGLGECVLGFAWGWQIAAARSFEASLPPWPPVVAQRGRRHSLVTGPGGLRRIPWVKALRCPAVFRPALCKSNIYVTGTNAFHCAIVGPCGRWRPSSQTHVCEAARATKRQSRGRAGFTKQHATGEPACCRVMFFRTGLSTPFRSHLHTATCATSPHPAFSQTKTETQHQGPLSISSCGQDPS